MLTELRIENFALIDALHLQFQPGFTVLTGETGAGKSLLVDAIGLLVGGRASSEQIRTGEEEAVLEAAFHLSGGHPLLRRLRDQGVMRSDESDLILKRVLSRSGRHRIYLNGSLCPLRGLEELGGTLVDIHGQHEQQSLLSTNNQLEALDAFGDLQDLRDRYQETYRRWTECLAQREAIAAGAADKARIQEMLRFQVDEISRAGLQPGEEAGLLAERQRLLHANRLRELAEEAYRLLAADEHGILGNVARVGSLLKELGQTDSSMEDAAPYAHEASIQLKELAWRLRDYAERTASDPERQGIVDERLSLLQRLKKKYGGTIEDVMAACVLATNELQSIEGSESRLREVTAELGRFEGHLQQLARELSKRRRASATRLTRTVAAELAALKLPQTLFTVSVSEMDEADRWGPSGCNRVEFMLSSNRGEPPKPLSKIASGGELSRIMLALKTVLAERDRVPVLVFDEIDTGVGGAVAAAMGIRLRTLGAFHQVFCITHLPQVASQADHHLRVQKAEDGSRTVTSVKALSGVAREEEIARMLGGVTVTKKVRETAAELIAGAGRPE
ncbi:MAG TPA: DNA repair protein RecN [Nitrospira sp.]|nr:DNA repair protein RecN [Nitrospira sp.]